MQLGKLLDGARSGRAITRPVQFKVVARNANEQVTTVPAEAALAFVSSEEHQEALVSADAALAKRFPSGAIPSNVRQSEQDVHFLAMALRDKADPGSPFGSVDDLRSALTAPVSIQVMAEYLRFVDEEFPDFVEDEEFEKLVEEASKKSLRDLLTSCGFSRIQKALPSLAGRFGSSLTQT